MVSLLKTIAIILMVFLATIAFITATSVWSGGYLPSQTGIGIAYFTCGVLSVGLIISIATNGKQ